MSLIDATPEQVRRIMGDGKAEQKVMEAMTARSDRIRDLEGQLAEAKDALRAVLAVTDEYAAEFVHKRRAVDWGLVNEAFIKAHKVLEGQ